MPTNYCRFMILAKLYTWPSLFLLGKRSLGLSGILLLVDIMKCMYPSARFIQITNWPKNLSRTLLLLLPHNEMRQLYLDLKAEMLLNVDNIERNTIEQNKYRKSNTTVPVSNQVCKLAIMMHA